MKKLEDIGVQAGKGKYYEEAIYSLGLIYNVVTDEMTTYLNQHGLTPGKFNILMSVKHRGRENGISQVDVSKSLIVSPSNMTKLLMKLEQDGLVERLELKGDKRVNMTRITAKGSKLLDQVWGGYNERLVKFYDVLSVAKQKALAALLMEWLEKIKEI